MNLARLARWWYRRRRLVLVLWIAVFAVMNILSSAFGNGYDNTFSGGSSDSATALSLLQTRFPKAAGDTATIAFEAKNGIENPAVRAHIEVLLSQVAGKVPHVVSVASPYQTPGQISRDDKVAFATVTFSGLASNLPPKTAQPLIDAAKRAEQPGLKVALGGPVVEQAVQKQGGSTEFIGILAAMVILFIAFGSFLAMSLPIIAAICGVEIGGTFVVLLSHVMSVPSFAPYLAVMIGLGVGIDYALFIVTRYRGGLQDGLTPEDADVLALTTSGRAVLFAGSTVIISLLGMFMIGSQSHLRLRRRCGPGRADGDVGLGNLGSGHHRFCRQEAGRQGPQTYQHQRDPGLSMEPSDPATPVDVGCLKPGGAPDAGDSPVLDSSRSVGPGQRPTVVYDPPSIRPLGAGLRSGIQRAVASDGRSRWIDVE